MIYFTCHYDSAINVGSRENIGSDWKFSRKDPGGRTLFENLGGREGATIAIPSGDEECLNQVDKLVIKINVFLTFLLLSL